MVEPPDGEQILEVLLNSGSTSTSSISMFLE
jgi:hypothetical protein